MLDTRQTSALEQGGEIAERPALIAIAKQLAELVLQDAQRAVADALRFRPSYAPAGRLTKTQSDAAFGVTQATATRSKLATIR